MRIIDFLVDLQSIKVADLRLYDRLCPSVCDCGTIPGSVPSVAHKMKSVETHIYAPLVCAEKGAENDEVQRGYTAIRPCSPVHGSIVTPVTCSALLHYTAPIKIPIG